MQIKIGGFAAFMISVIVIGGIVQVVEAVANREVTPKRPRRDKLWARMAELVKQGKGNYATLAKCVEAETENLFRQACMETQSPDELEGLKIAYQNKLAQLS